MPWMSDDGGQGMVIRVEWNTRGAGRVKHLVYKIPYTIGHAMEAGCGHDTPSSDNAQGNHHTHQTGHACSFCYVCVLSLHLCHDPRCSRDAYLVPFGDCSPCYGHGPRLYHNLSHDPCVHVCPALCIQISVSKSLCWCAANCGSQGTVSVAIWGPWLSLHIWGAICLHLGRNELHLGLVQHHRNRWCSGHGCWWWWFGGNRVALWHLRI